MLMMFFAQLFAVVSWSGAEAAAQHRGRSAAMDPDAKRPTTEEAARMRTERMTEALGLDETQARTVYDQCLREAQLQRQLSEVRQENAANMKRILNEKQYAEWQRMHERRRGRMHHGTRPEGPSGAACCEGPCPAQKEACPADCGTPSGR